MAAAPRAAAESGVDTGGFAPTTITVVHRKPDHGPSLDEPQVSSTQSQPKLSLAQVMPVAHLTLWEAWDEPLELIGLYFGDVPHPTLALEPEQMAPGTLWNENVYPADREKLRQFLASREVVKTAKWVDYRLIGCNGELLWVRQWLLQRSPAEHGRHRLQGMLMPIPEQKQLEWECLRVSERECNRIGQELHDDLCQVLAGLTFMMRVLGQGAAKVSPDLAKEIHDLNTQVIGATDRVRAMARGLFPAQLNSSSLRDALNELSRQTRLRFAVKFDLDLPRRLPPHTADQIIQIYRIVQEAVSNAVRHGRATTINVRATFQHQTLQLDIEDDGSGLPAPVARPEGIGMHVMQYRARVLSGAIRFKNLSPRGTVVRLTYPISQALARGAKKDGQLR